MPTYILGIESSCDDTSASVLCDGKVLSNLIANQEIHKSFGGVVPELASRAHQQNIIPVVNQAIAVFAYTTYVVAPNSAEAGKEMSKAIKWFETDSMALALNGNGDHAGFLDIMDEYRNEFIDAFTLGMSWEDHQNEMVELGKVTKQEIIDFANAKYADNYVVVYKRNGEDKSVLKVTKPAITPVSVNLS